MAIYDSEEEQLEAVKAWWRENGVSVIVGVIMGAILIAGFSFWRSYKQEQAELAADAYSQLTKAVAANDSGAIEQLSKRLHDEFSNTGYAAYGGLQQAKLQVQKGDLAGAKATLQQVVGQANKELKHIARLRLIRLLLASGEYEQGLQVINDVEPSAASGFAASYDELAGDLYVALDRLDEARNAYQNALNSGGPSPLLKLKIDDLTPGEPVPVAQPAENQ